MTSLFISVEGIDCCGKGTQTRLLADSLSAKRFKFPDKNTPLGALIYDHLFERWAAIGAVEANAADDSSEQSDILSEGLVDPMTFQALQTVNRLEHAKAITKALKLGVNVVADRYIASGLVYGGADNLDVGYLATWQEYLPQPDLRILLDITPEQSIERIKARGDVVDRYEKRGDHIKEVYRRYHELWKMGKATDKSWQWVIADGSVPSIEVAAQISVMVKAARINKDRLAT